MSQLTSGGAVAGPAILSSPLLPSLTILIGGSSQQSNTPQSTLPHSSLGPYPTCRPLKPHRPSTVARWYSRPLTSPPDLNRLCLLPPSFSLLASTSTRHTTHDTTRIFAFPASPSLWSRVTNLPPVPTCPTRGRLPGRPLTMRVPRIPWIRSIPRYNPAYCGRAPSASPADQTNSPTGPFSPLHRDRHPTC